MTLFKYILWMSARSWFTVQCVVLGKYWVPILRRFKFEDTVQQFAKVFILHTGLAKAYHRLGQQTRLVTNIGYSYKNGQALTWRHLYLKYYPDTRH